MSQWTVRACVQELSQRLARRRELNARDSIHGPMPSGAISLTLAQADAVLNALKSLESFLGYQAHDASTPPDAVCLDCGLPYEQFPLDVILPRAQWLEIHPAEHGLLCATCIVKRAANVPGVTCAHMILEIAVRLSTPTESDQ